MRTALQWFGTGLARFLSRETHIHGTAPPTRPERLLATLRPGDVLLVEGNSRLSAGVKYLTQSTWSHAALFVGSRLAGRGGNPGHCFVDADTVAGVRSIGTDAFAHLHSRICRPIGLTEEECRRVTTFAIARIGSLYDLRNVVDLARYLLPTPPVPQRFRRSMLALGSGDPTRAICSTLIAQAFQSIRYPILVSTDLHNADRPDCPGCVDEIHRARHHSLITPRDFDVSPYFEVVKPTIVNGFDFRRMTWGDVAGASVR